MKQVTKKLRLDEILLMQGSITQEQIAEALMRQKVSGGKFGSQLLFHRYIDEKTLVDALAAQFNCDSVVLSNLEIEESVIQLIPAKQAIVRRVLPFEYDKKSNTLKIACEDPSDPNLDNELGFAARGKLIKLYVASELALETAINKYYLGQDTNLEDNLSLVLPDFNDTDKDARIAENDTAPADKQTTANAVLLVTNEEYSGSLYQTILQRDDYQVTVCNSCEKAIESIDNSKFNFVLIKDSVPGDMKNLFERLRKMSPRTTVRTFASSASLLLENESSSPAEQIARKNLDLFTSLLSYKENIPLNYGGIIGQYVDKLCQKLGLPKQDQLVIVDAAYLHNLARYYYHDIDEKNHPEIVKLTAKLLKSLGYIPAVAEILEYMYSDAVDKNSRNISLEALGGNIITIADMLCENIQTDQKLTLDKFDAIKKKMRELSGKRFFREVVEAFIGVMQEEILSQHTSTGAAQIMIYANDLGAALPLELRLKNDGFRVVTASTIDSLANLYGRSSPDIMILVIKGNPDEITASIDNLGINGLDYRQTPTFLLIIGDLTANWTSLLEKGIEDVMSFDNNFDLLIVKLRKIQSQLLAKSGAISMVDDRSIGAHGTLKDMNLIDLMQALAPGRKTAKISIKSNTHSSSQLDIVLNQGQIIFAKLDDKSGAEAIYEGMTWTEGNWQVEPLDDKDLPVPNNRLSNDAILMEGVYRLDEKAKVKQT